jgi:hypothetical protein
MVMVPLLLLTLLLLLYPAVCDHLRWQLDGMDTLYR